MPLPNLFTSATVSTTRPTGSTSTRKREQYDSVVRVDIQLHREHYFFSRVAWGQQNTLCDNVNGGAPRYPGGPAS